jgi:hypothetical protein
MKRIARTASRFQWNCHETSTVLHNYDVEARRPSALCQEVNQDEHKSRQQHRYVTLVLFLLFGLALIFHQGRGFSIRGVPGEWVGFLSLAMALSGLLGINVWIGGPLDKDEDRRRSRLLPPRTWTSADSRKVWIIHGFGLAAAGLAYFF